MHAGSARDENRIPMRLGLLQVKLADQFVRAYRQGQVVHWQAGQRTGWPDLNVWFAA
jgi:hypothetical protein